MRRQPRILGRAEFDQHHGIRVCIIMGGIKGEPVETSYLTPAEALAFAESLVRSARQSLRDES